VAGVATNVEIKVGKVKSDEVYIWAQALITNPLDLEMLRELNIDWNSNTNTYSQQKVEVSLTDQEVRKDMLIHLGTNLEGKIEKYRAQCLKNNYTRLFYVNSLDMKSREKV
jgi:hypothetical protein